MSKYFGRKLIFHKGGDTGARSSFFNHHCSVRGTSSISDKPKATDCRACEYAKKRYAVMAEKPAINQWENFDKLRTPCSTINPLCFERLRNCC